MKAESGASRLQLCLRRTSQEHYREECRTEGWWARRRRRSSSGEAISWGRSDTETEEWRQRRATDSETAQK